MTPLKARFQATFFESWAAAQLPDPSLHVQSYLGALRQLVVPVPAGSGPLRREVTQPVYGFGVMVGALCGRLLGLSDDVVQPRLDWNGRFNLGISLFDYLMDEVSPESALSALPSDWPFHFEPGGSNSLEQMVLAGLIRDLLADLQFASGPSQSGVMHLLQRMLSAQLRLSDEPLQSRRRPSELCRLLLDKSVRPFEVLSMQAAVPDVPWSRARRVGRAVGWCYALFDDVSDVWEDLDAGRWNLLLVAALKRDRDVLTEVPGLSLELRLGRAWAGAATVEILARGAVRQLHQVIGDAPSPHSSEALGWLGLSLQQW